MIAAELISDTLPPLKTSDTGDIAIQLMSDYGVKQLPIVNDQQFLGLISEEGILEQGLIEEPIGSMPLSYYRPYVEGKDHVYQVMRVATNLKLTLIPVVDADQNYMGVITLETLLYSFARLNSITDPGGIIELELNNRDYSFSEISRIIESNDATILSLYTHNDPESNKMSVTVKVNREDLQHIIATFERYNYNVVGTFQKSDFGDDMRDRYDSLIRYLNT